MASVEKSVLIGYSAKQMFEIVDNIEAYPEFLPWCSDAKILERYAESVVATLYIDYLHLKQQFTTENRRVAPSLIEMRLREGPFKHLEGSWRFLPLAADACKVEFRLHYEFSSRTLENLSSPVFGLIAGTLLDAFVERAEKCYGE